MSRITITADQRRSRSLDKETLIQVVERPGGRGMVGSRVPVHPTPPLPRLCPQSAPPSMEKVRRHAMPPCHRTYRLPGLVARLDDPKLLFRRPVPPTRRSGDQFDPLIVVRHKYVIGDIPKLSSYAGCPVEMGASSQ
jgi:hypothetical protein